MIDDKKLDSIYNERNQLQSDQYKLDSSYRQAKMDLFKLKTENIRLKETERPKEKEIYR